MRQSSEKQSDPFWLGTVFPDPLEVFGFSAPPVSTLFADALFGLDTNALLAPYQVSKQSADETDHTADCAPPVDKRVDVTEARKKLSPEATRHVKPSESVESLQ